MQLRGFGFVAAVVLVGIACGDVAPSREAAQRWREVERLAGATSVGERLKAVAMIPSIAVAADDRVFALLRLTHDADRRVVLAAVQGLGRTPAPSSGAEAVRRLVTLSTSESTMLRAECVSSLSRLAPRTEETRSVVLRALEDSEYRVRASGYFALGSLGEDAREAMPLLAVVLESGSEAERAAAATAIEDLGYCSERARRALAACLQEPTAIVRAASLLALSSLDDDALDSATARALLTDEDPQVRNVAKRVLSGR